MTTPAFSALSGRTPLRSSYRSSVRPGRSLVQGLRRHVARRRFLAARREHERRLRTDAYLDRTGMDSVDWADALARHGGR